MSTQTINAYLYMSYGYGGDYSKLERKWRADIQTFKSPDSEREIFVREIAVSVEVPDNFDPIPKQVAAVEKEREEATAAYMKTLGDINERLSKLQAISYSPEPALAEPSDDDGDPF